MTILVIGNGFDLAHHLPTQYSSFLDFAKAFKESEDSGYSEFINDIKENNDSLYSEINSLIQNNVLLDYFLAIYEERCKDNRRGWIDFESEISEIVQNLDAGKQDIEKKYALSGEAAKLDKVISQRLAPIIDEQKKFSQNVLASEYFYEPRFFDYTSNRVLDALNRLTRLLEIYLHEYVEKIDCKYRISDLKSINIDNVLSFNYTDTYKKYYDSEGKAKYCFIHGKTKDGNLETCNLVLGIDEYLPIERKDTDNRFVWFKKFYQRIFRETGSEYLDWIKHFEDFNKTYKKDKPSHLDLYIYGHSLDVTDKDVLSRLILMKNTTTYIFYHSHDAMAKQINNLVKVIGEDNLIRMTGGKDRSIRFIHSSPAIKEGY